MVNHNGAAGWQLHRAGIRRLDLVLNLKARKQRCVVTVAFDAVLMLGHHMGHELASLLVNVISVEQNVANVAVEVVTNRANHQAGFLVNQESAFTAFASAFNRGPELDQVVQVPLQLGSAATDTGRAGDDAGALWVLQLVHIFFEFSPVFAFNPAANPTAARVVGHQNDIATGQRYKCGQRCTLVATLFFFDLDHQLLALANHVIDARLVNRHARREVVA